MWPRRALAPPLRISYINGINNTRHDVERAAEHISAAFGGRATVRPFWNPSAGAYADVLKTASMKLINFQWPGEEPPEVTGLARHLRECVVAQPSAEGRILHLAHSQVGPCKPANQETKLCARKREVVWARGKDFIQTS
jgi:hypothetical protein